MLAARLGSVMHRVERAKAKLSSTLEELSIRETTLAMLTLGAKPRLYGCSTSEEKQVVVHPARGYTIVDICENCENYKTYVMVGGEITEV